MATFERIIGDRLHELRSSGETGCQYDACIQRLSELSRADIDQDHEYLRSAVEAAGAEFETALKANGHLHLVQSALNRVAEEKARCKSECAFGHA